MHSTSIFHMNIHTLYQLHIYTLYIYTVYKHCVMYTIVLQHHPSNTYLSALLLLPESFRILPDGP